MSRCRRDTQTLARAHQWQHNVSSGVCSARQDYAQPDWRLERFLGHWTGFRGCISAQNKTRHFFIPVIIPASECMPRKTFEAAQDLTYFSINSASRSESEGDGAKGHVPSCASTLRRASRSALSIYPSECGDWGQSWSWKKTNHRKWPDRLQISHASELLVVLLVGHEGGRGGFTVHRFGQHLVKWRHPCTSPDPRLSNIPAQHENFLPSIGSFRSYTISLNGSPSNLLDVLLSITRDTLRRHGTTTSSLPA